MSKISLSVRLFDIGAVRFGTFTLKSGLTSPIYLDLRRCVSYPDTLEELAQRIEGAVSASHYDCVCGVPYTALPFATAFSLRSRTPMVMRRKEVKNYGTRQSIEGVFQPGQICLVVEDLITSGQSVLETVQPLRQEGLCVEDVVVVVDREQGGKAALEEQGFRVHTLLTLSQLLSELVDADRISSKVREDVLTYISDTTAKPSLTHA